MILNIQYMKINKRASREDNMTKEKIESIMQDVRDLRDADFHVCKHSEWQSKGEPDGDEDITCSCGEFDAVLDKLEKLKV